jgi:hypothetical protein
LLDVSCDIETGVLRGRDEQCRLTEIDFLVGAAHDMREQREVDGIAHGPILVAIGLDRARDFSSS